MRLFIAVAAAALLAAPAFAKTKFEALETRDPMIVEGKGGTKVNKNGIDYWTSGSPPKRHQVLGLIKDNRENVWWNGNAVGSKAVAKLVKEAGGDAVVILDQNDRATGVISGGQASSTGSAQATCYGYTCSGTSTGQTYGSAWSNLVTERSTVMIVVKYLPDEAQ